MTSAPSAPEAVAPRILDGLRIVDLSWGLAGPVATQLLAEAGADVVKVEPPGGDPTRALAAFATWNRSKRSVVLDLHDPAGRAQLDALLASADVLVHGLRPSSAERHGLDGPSLAVRFPRLVVSAVTGYPGNHVDAERPGYDLLVQARSGLMDEQLGWREGPIALRFPLPSWAAASLAAAGILARLLVRERTGLGGVCHTSLLQGMLNTISLVWSRAEQPAPALLSSKHDLPPQVAMYQCGDGIWLQIMNPGERIDIGALPLTQQVLAEIGEPLISVDAVALRKAFVHRTSDQWLTQLRAADVAVEPALALGEMLRMPELREYGYLVDVEDPEWGATTQVATPFRTCPPSAVTRPAPRLGEHNDEVLGHQRSVPVIGSSAPNVAYPLEGLKVLDLGAFLAGPMAPMLLGDMGADVIKVEPIVGDRMRFMANFFEACSRGKRSIAVDLTRPEGQEVLDRLVAWADVVHHNQRMRAARKLGIDDAGLRARNPDVVFGYVSAYGPTGSRGDWPGFDSIFQALGGWEVGNAGEGNPPLFSRFGSLDVQCALASLVSTLLALYHRQQTGLGTEVVGSLLGVTAFTQSETLMRADGSLAPYRVTDAGQYGLSESYRLFECQGGWVAVAAMTDSQRAALLEVAGVTDVASVAAGLRGRPQAEVVAALETAAVPAEPAREGMLYEFFDDEAHRAAGLVAEYPHTAYGTMEQPGAFWDFGDLDLRLDRGSPVLGEHTQQILSLLGYDNGAISALIEAGVVGVSAAEVSGAV